MLIAAQFLCYAIVLWNDIGVLLPFHWKYNHCHRLIGVTENISNSFESGHIHYQFYWTFLVINLILVQVSCCCCFFFFIWINLLEKMRFSRSCTVMFFFTTATTTNRRKKKHTHTKFEWVIIHRFTAQLILRFLEFMK